jgi:hypothetical protein
MSPFLRERLYWAGEIPPERWMSDQKDGCRRVSIRGELRWSARPEGKRGFMLHATPIDPSLGVARRRWVATW